MSYAYPSSPASSSSAFTPRPLNTSPKNGAVEPLTRSRTLFYLSIRDSSIPLSSRKGKGRQYGDTLDVADEEEGLIGAQDGRVGLPPRWCADKLVGSEAHRTGWTSQKRLRRS